jgi:hypothetical protein
MTTTTDSKHQSNCAYSAVLAHASYACIQKQDFEQQLRALVVGVKILCAEYDIDFNAINEIDHNA